VGCDARLIGLVQGRFAFPFGGALPSLDNPPPDEPGFGEAHPHSAQLVGPPTEA